MRLAPVPRVLAVSLAAALATWIATAPPGIASALVWRGEALIAGTDRGLFAHGASGWALVLARGGVLDLGADAEGLWIATPAGLYRWRDGESAPQPVPLGAGARVRSIAVDAAGGVWVASEAGLFRRASGGAGFEREIALPPGPVLAARAAGAELWVAMSGALWRRTAGGFERALAALDEGWWELHSAVSVEGASLLGVPRGLWRIDARGSRRVELGEGVLHAVLPVDGVLWLASDRGVRAYAPAELSAGAGEALLEARAHSLARRGAAVLVATDRGIAQLERGGGAPGPAPRASSLRSDPDIRAVQQDVLAYLELSPERLTELERRARHAGWLPEVRAGVQADRERNHGWGNDAVLSSGTIHHLLDRDGGRDTALRMEMDLIWDLPRTAAPDDALAISRERRLLIELRDQVLERVNRLYFERQRLRGRLAAALEGERPELELRAREIAAQLDAWTGGRFSRAASDSPP